MAKMATANPKIASAATPLRSRKRTAAHASLSLADGACSTVSSDQQAPAKDVESLKRRLCEISSRPAETGLQAFGMSFDSLEAYKHAVDSTTKAQKCSGLPNHASDGVEQIFTRESEPQSSQTILEWEGLANGTILGYRLCDDHDEDLQMAQYLLARGNTTKGNCASANEPEDSAADSSELGSVQVPLGHADQSWHFSEWRDETTGALLGFSPCDDEEPFEWNSICQGSATDGDSESSEVSSQEEQQSCHWSEWKDKETGAILGYLPSEDAEVIELNTLFQGSAMDKRGNTDCDASDLIVPEAQSEHEHQPWHCSEWKDHATGALLGYLPCEDEEALELNIAFQGTATDDNSKRDDDDGDLAAPAVLPEEEHDVRHCSESNNQTTGTVFNHVSSEGVAAAK